MFSPSGRSASLVISVAYGQPGPRTTIDHFNAKASENVLLRGIFRRPPCAQLPEWLDQKNIPSIAVVEPQRKNAFGAEMAA
jgi:hypothetical protein